MSCHFHLLRKRRAAEKAKAVPITEEKPVEKAKKPSKKGGPKDGE